jgi:hypothetical protein
VAKRQVQLRDLVLPFRGERDEPVVFQGPPRGDVMRPIRGRAIDDDEPDPIAGVLQPGEVLELALEQLALVECRHNHVDGRPVRRRPAIWGRDTGCAAQPESVHGEDRQHQGGRDDDERPHH